MPTIINPKEEHEKNTLLLEIMETEDLLDKKTSEYRKKYGRTPEEKKDFIINSIFATAIILIALYAAYRAWF